MPILRPVRVTRFSHTSSVPQNTESFVPVTAHLLNFSNGNCLPEGILHARNDVNIKSADKVFLRIPIRNKASKFKNWLVDGFSSGKCWKLSRGAYFSNWQPFAVC